MGLVVALWCCLSCRTEETVDTNKFYEDIRHVTLLVVRRAAKEKNGGLGMK